MKATAKLHELGQSIWLDNITREMLDSGRLERYIDQYSVTGLTSNPSIFDKAIASGAYDDAIRGKASAGDREALFFELAIEDLQRAADLFAPIHARTDGVDGWVSLEVSPVLAYDTANTVRAAKELHERGQRANLFIKIPGTATLLAFYDHGEVGEPMPADGGDAEATLAEFASAGIDVDQLAAKLQSDGAQSFIDAWNDLMARIEEQRTAVHA